MFLNISSNTYHIESFDARESDSPYTQNKSFRSNLERKPDVLSKSQHKHY